MDKVCEDCLRKSYIADVQERKEVILKEVDEAITIVNNVMRNMNIRRKALQDLKKGVVDSVYHQSGIKIWGWEPEK